MLKSKLVFLGDSLTMRHNWSNFKATNMGIDGDTTAGVLSRMHLASEAETIVLMISVNDILNQIPLNLRHKVPTEQNVKNIWFISKKIIFSIAFTVGCKALQVIPKCFALGDLGDGMNSFLVVNP